LLPYHFYPHLQLKNYSKQNLGQPLCGVRIILPLRFLYSCPRLSKWHRMRLILRYYVHLPILLLCYFCDLIYDHILRSSNPINIVRHPSQLKEFSRHASGNMRWPIHDDHIFFQKVLFYISRSSFYIKINIYKSYSRNPWSAEPVTKEFY